MIKIKGGCLFILIMPYREFMISGEGIERNIDSTRDNPRFILSAPLLIKSVNVKSVEIPLSFNPSVGPTEMPVITTYTNGGGLSIKFRDYIAFTQNVQCTGLSLTAKLQDILTAHRGVVFNTFATSPAISATGVSTPGLISNTFPGADSFTGTATATLITSGDNEGTIQYSIANTLTTSAVLTSVTVDFIGSSVLSSLMDYSYYLPAITTCNILATGRLLNDLSLTPTMRTRPSFFYLHSNLRAGLVYHSTARPQDTLGTVLAKIHLPQSADVSLGSAVYIWVNPSQEPSLMYTLDGSTYSALEFWLTYPDNKTRVTLIGNYFSLTLATFT